MYEEEGEKIVYLFVHHIFHASFGIRQQERCHSTFSLGKKAKNKLEMRKKSKKNIVYRKAFGWFVVAAGDCCSLELISELDSRLSLFVFRQKKT